MAPLDPVILPELALAVQQLDSMANSVPVDAPWNAPSAADWDGQTLETWIKANSASDKFRRLVPLATRPIFGAEPRELSLLFVLFYIAASGNETNPGTFERNFDTRNGGQMWRLAGGSQQIALRIAAQLGKRVVLKSPVRRIVQKGGRVTVESDRYSVRCKRVIVAIPPTLAGRIDYHPLLPPERDQLTQRYGQGTLTKVAAVYDKPFWRDKGLTGQAVSIDGLVSATFDDSPQSGIAWRDLRVRRRRLRAQVPAHVPAGGARQGARRVRVVLRRGGAQPEGLLRDALDDRAVDARLPRRHRRPRHAAGLRRSAAHALRQDPLGGHGDLDVLERLHGRRRALRPARRQRGAGRAMRRALLIALLATVVPAAAGAQRPRWDTRTLATVPPPGFPARAYVAPNGRIYEGTYDNPAGDTVPSRVFEYLADGTLLRSWTVQGQDLSQAHGIQVATSDAQGRLVLLDKAPARVVKLDPRTGAQTTYATFADLPTCGAPPCSPALRDETPMADYGAWGPDGSLYVTDYQQAVIWRVPPGGGAAQVWLADKRLDGDMFGTAGIALAADHTTLVISQGSSAGLGAGNPATGRIYTVPIAAGGKPRRAQAALGERAGRGAGRPGDRGVRPDLRGAREPAGQPARRGRAGRQRGGPLAGDVRRAVQRGVPRHQPDRRGPELRQRRPVTHADPRRRRRRARDPGAHPGKQAEGEAQEAPPQASPPQAAPEAALIAREAPR